MKTVRMGRTGLKVSEICLGTMTFGVQCDEATSFRIMDRAFDGGVTFFDTADVYPLPHSFATVGRTEEIVGRWLRERRRRDDIVLATKGHDPMSPRPTDRGSSRKHLTAALDASLRRLGTDYVDLYQVHRWDPETPIDETLRAMDDFIRAGKVRYAGCSNFKAWQLAKSLWVSDRLGIARFDCLQPRYNLLYREADAELLPLCRAEGIGVIAYNPLAGGFLSGKYRKGQAPVEGTRFTLGKAGETYRERYWEAAQFEVVETLRPLFERRGQSLATAAVAWVLRQPGITSAIVGASRPEQLDATLAATSFTFDDETLAACDAAWFHVPRRVHAQ
ncbi:MAG TPA: aldo/keto reductase [Thermodesulfobacteriota bacterium]